MLSFGQFASRVQHLAGALVSLGLEKGDRLSLLSQNRADYLTYHFATSMLGVVLHVMNTRQMVREWAWAVNDARSSGLVVDEAHAAPAEALSRACPTLRFVLGIGGVAGADFATEALVAATERVRKAPSISPEDPVLLIYTSGTTGVPKGCQQSQRGSTTVDELSENAMGATERDVYMAIMPYFHQAGMIEEGYLYFVDRKKDLIKTGGENVYPQEVEAVLSQHPSIAEVTVIGLPDPTWGQAVTAVIVPRGGGDISLGDIKELCKGKLAGYKVPKAIELVDEIPRNETGAERLSYCAPGFYMKPLL